MFLLQRNIIRNYNLPWTYACSLMTLKWLCQGFAPIFGVQFVMMREEISLFCCTIKHWSQESSKVTRGIKRWTEEAVTLRWSLVALSIIIKLRCSVGFILIEQLRGVIFISVLYLNCIYLDFKKIIWRLEPGASRCPFGSEVLGFVKCNTSGFKELVA